MEFMKYNRLPVCILFFISVFIILCSCGEVSNNENRTTHKPESSAASTLDSSSSPSSTPETGMYAITYEQLVDSILREAQTVADFIRDNDFDYSEDLRINPAYNWAELDETKALDSSERLVSCDRFVGWVLYRVGFTDQPKDTGYLVYTFSEFCEAMGFKKITKVATLQPGDIVFINPNSAHGGKPGHMFICASDNMGYNVYLRYDAGSQQRVECVKGTELEKGKQPFKEKINNFCYAYRPCVDELVK